MVIGDKFAWAHFAKTGGLATLRLFELFPELVRSADPSDVRSHATFKERDALIRGKLLVMGFRRLPAWTVSLAQQKALHGTGPILEPGTVETAEYLAGSTWPDRSLKTVLANGKYSVGRWLRTESLQVDFLAFVSELMDVPNLTQQRVLSLGRVHQHEYGRRLDQWLPERYLERLYDNNPVWAILESKLYGSRE